MPMRITVHDMELYNHVPINEMAYRKVQMEAKLIAQTRNIIEWWGFLYYMANYADVNHLTNHEKGKLRSLLKELYEDKLVTGNPSKVKRNTLLLHWGEGDRNIPGIEVLTDKNRVASIISDRFYVENIGTQRNLGCRFQSIHASRTHAHRPHSRRGCHPNLCIYRQYVSKPHRTAEN